MKQSVLLLILVWLFSCSEDSTNPDPDVTIHLAGSMANDVGSYWKNGIYSDLDDSFARINSMSVDGSSVVIGGWQVTPNTLEIGYWQNSKVQIIEGGYPGVMLIASENNKLFGAWNLLSKGWVYSKDGTTSPMDKTGWPTAIAVSQGNLYIAGASQGNEYPFGSDRYPKNNYAMCWKDDKLIFKENVISVTTAIAIYQNDIYTTGYLNQYESDNRIACLWKNGERVQLTDNTQNAIGTSLFLTAEGVYVSGIINNKAVYWKSGVVTTLESPSKSKANSIFIDGEDIYVAGSDNGYPAYWKNGIRQKIEKDDEPGEIKFVAVSKN